MAVQLTKHPAPPKQTPSAATTTKPTCLECGIVRYCSLACQKKHWKFDEHSHKLLIQAYIRCKLRTTYNLDGCWVPCSSCWHHTSKPELNGAQEAVKTKDVGKEDRWHVLLDKESKATSCSWTNITVVAPAPSPAHFPSADIGGVVCLRRNMHAV